MKIQLGGPNVWMLSLVLIFLSACGSRPEPAPVSTVYRGPSYHDYAPASWAEDAYTVRSGDTLYSIAFRANMDVRTIAQLNSLTEPYRLYPEQVLTLKAPPVIAKTNKTTTSTVRNSQEEQAVVAGRVDPVVSFPQTRYGENISKAPEAKVENSARSVATNPSVQVRPPVPRPSSQERVIASADIRWQWPSKGSIVKRFSTREPMNRGIEFSGSKGDLIVAAAAGKVVYVGTALRGYGRLVIVKHNDDYITAYGHNDSVLVREQQWVEAGQQIATMGSSGREDVRLRFELRLRGNSVNPENYLPRSR